MRLKLHHRDLTRARRRPAVSAVAGLLLLCLALPGAARAKEQVTPDPGPGNKEYALPLDQARDVGDSGGGPGGGSAPGGGAGGGGVAGSPTGAVPGTSTGPVDVIRGAESRPTDPSNSTAVGAKLDRDGAIAGASGSSRGNGALKGSVSASQAVSARPSPPFAVPTGQRDSTSVWTAAGLIALVSGLGAVFLRSLRRRGV
jgi:hypothetical protein